MSQASRVRHPNPIDAISDWHHVRHLAAHQATVLLMSEDPVYAECAAIAATMAHLVPAAEAMGVVAAGQHERELLHEYIPQFAEDRMLVMLLAVASVNHGRVRQAASAAADRLIAAGQTVPEWARELRDPITVSECVTVTNGDGGLLELICTLVRSGHSSASRIQVDEHRCGAAFGVWVGIEDRLPLLLKARQRVDAHLGRPSTFTPVRPAEFRGLVEAAFDARAVHDQTRSLALLHELAFKEDLGTLEPGYQLLATLWRSRLRSFPAAASTRPPHRSGPGCPMTSGA